jgi:hypothetical protein
VTIKVTLKRFSLLDVDKRREEIAEGKEKGMLEKNNGLAIVEKEAMKDEEGGGGDEQSQQNKRKVWEKQPKKKMKKGGKSTQKVVLNFNNLEILIKF